MLGYITDTRVINSRPISPLILALPPPIAVIDTLVSLVSWIFALARTEIRGRAKEGSLERIVRVVAGKILFRLPSCPATEYRGKRARTEIFYSTRDSIDLSPSTFDHEKWNVYEVRSILVLLVRIREVKYLFLSFPDTLTFHQFLTNSIITLGNNRGYLSVLMSEKCVR